MKNPLQKENKCLERQYKNEVMHSHRSKCVMSFQLVTFKRKFITIRKYIFFHQNKDNNNLNGVYELLYLLI